MQGAVAHSCIETEVERKGESVPGAGGGLVGCKHMGGCLNISPHLRVQGLHQPLLTYTATHRLSALQPCLLAVNTAAQHTPCQPCNQAPLQHSLTHLNPPPPGQPCN